MTKRLSPVFKMGICTMIGLEKEREKSLLIREELKIGDVMVQFIITRIFSLRTAQKGKTPSFHILELTIDFCLIPDLSYQKNNTT